MATKPKHANDDFPTEFQKSDTKVDDTSILKDLGQGNNFATVGYIRFLLAVVVMVSHAKWFANFNVPIISAWPDGQAAVCGFFILSGWVICSSVNRDIKHFYNRRAERLMPIYVVCLAWAMIPYYLFGRLFSIPGSSDMLEAPLSRWYIVDYFFFLQNFVNVNISTFNPAWSLSCEVFYYAVAPFIRRIGSRWLLIFAGISLAALLLKKLANVDDIAVANFGIGTFLMAWAWILGFVAYRFRTTRPLVAVVLLVSAGCFWQQGSGYLVLLTALALLFGHRVKFRPLAEKLGIILGDMSYPLYLSHLATLIIVARLLPLTMPLRTMIGLSSAVAFAAILLFLIDIPCQSFFKRGRFKMSTARF
jgi:peptidoglycan/LPS O-acetylase OafA/YrhL